MFRILLSSKCFAVSICEMHCSACLPLPGQKKKTNKTKQLNILRYIQLFGVYITYSVRLDQQSYYSVFKNTYNRLHKHKIRKKHELINTNYFLSQKKIQPKAERERERIQEQDLTVSLSLSLLCYYEYLHNPIPSNAGVLFALILFFFPSLFVIWKQETFRNAPLFIFVCRRHFMLPPVNQKRFSYYFDYCPRFLCVNNPSMKSVQSATYILLMIRIRIAFD